MSDTVAIIMRARNEMPYVQRCLDMLQRQTFQNFELFAFDSGSTDGTLEVLRQACAADRLTQIAGDEYVPGKVLNQAITDARHNIIVLLNADAVPQGSDWLEKLIAPVAGDVADATYSRQAARSDAPFIVSYDYDRAYISGSPSDGFFSAVACAFRRDLWERFKFHEDGFAEDAVWAATCRMFNSRIQLVPESVVEHSHNYTLEELFAKRFQHGMSFGKFHGEVSPIRRRLYLCTREITRDLIFACRQHQFRTIPYNIAYRVTIHAGLHRGIREGSL